MSILFGEIALALGMITREQLDNALAIQQAKASWQIGEILAFFGYLDDAQIAQIIEIQRQNSNRTGTQVVSFEPVSKNSDTASSAQELASHSLLKSDHGNRTVSHIIAKEVDGKKFGRYRILSEIGRGGMGRVYKAYDAELDRIVALKVLISGDSASHNEIERFLREAKATAKLRHPHIVTVYDIGNEKGQNFFTMDFLEGLSLKAYVRQFSPPIPQLVNIMIKVGRAVHYAHSREIIHRDIKPSNIMVDIHQEPRVMDFGLAKLISASSTATDTLSKTGDVLGTPAYMSPEQSESKTIDLRSDVYSLGATLYEALTGRPPFQGESYLDILYRIVHREPQPPRKINPKIPPQLEAICLKCLEKNPAKRYPSALVFVHDMENFLANKPIVAKNHGKWTYVKRIVQDHHDSPIAIKVILFMLLVIGMICFIEWLNMRNETKQKTEQMQKAEIKSKLQMARLTMGLVRAAREHQQWANCGVYAGVALEFMKDLNDKDVIHLREEATNYVFLALRNYQNLTQITIQSETTHQIPDWIKHSLNTQPEQTTRKIFQRKVTEQFTIEIISDDLSTQ